MRQRSYLVLLVFGAALGAPISAVAYFYLALVSRAQKYFFTTLWHQAGFSSEPAWWPIPVLVVGGVLCACAIHFLPGEAGHEPSEGFKPAGATQPIELYGVIAASLATLCFGVVLGPEAPLIAMGGGFAILVVHLVKKDAPPMAVMVIGAAGSFAAIAALLGSPIVGAILLLEAAGIGGGLISVVLVPGFLAAGIGSLIFVGLDDWTGLGQFSFGVPDLPKAGSPTGAEFLWAIAIGVMATVLGSAIRALALYLRRFVQPRRLLVTPVFGAGVGLCALVFAETAHRSPNAVLFSGQTAIYPLIEQAATWSVASLVLLIIFKGVAYGLSLSAFRGGPTFPGMFIGAAGGIALSHLAGLSMIAGAGMGIGAMTVVMLNGMPITAVVLVALFLQSDAVAILPLVIVSVVVAYVGSAYAAPQLAKLMPALAPKSPAEPAPAAAPTG